MQVLWHLIRSYLFGIVVGTALCFAALVLVSAIHQAVVQPEFALGIVGAVAAAGTVAALVAAAGGVLALPLFAAVTLIYACFRRGIEANLLAWCIAAPFLLTVVWIALEWLVVFRFQSSGSLGDHLITPAAWMRVPVAFVCAAAAAYRFHTLRTDARDHPTRFSPFAYCCERCT